MFKVQFIIGDKTVNNVEHRRELPERGDWVVFDGEDFVVKDILPAGVGFFEVVLVRATPPDLG